MPVATAQDVPEARHNLQAARQAYYDKISAFNMTPAVGEAEGSCPARTGDEMRPRDVALR